MPKQNVYLFVMPWRHYLRWSSCVMEEIIAQNRRPWHQIITLEDGDAVPDKIDEAIKTHDPMVVWGVGHGSPDVYTCECMARYLWVGSDRVELFRGRIVHLNSCYTARRLGPHLIERGALAYYGSRDPFWFYIGDPCCWPNSRAVRAVFLCEHQTIASLMNGKTTLEAHQDRLRRYEEEIEYWTVGPGKNHPHAPGIARILEIDMSIATFLGEETARPSPPLPRPIPIAPLSAILGGVMIIGSQYVKL